MQIKIFMSIILYNRHLIDYCLISYIVWSSDIAEHAITSIESSYRVKQIFSLYIWVFVLGYRDIETYVL